VIRRAVSIALAITVVVSACSGPARPQGPESPLTQPKSPPGTVFDDFNGPAGSTPDRATWDFDVGPYQDAGTQTYTSSPANVRLDGQGHLVIQALRTPSGYTSARPVTRGKVTMLYGTVTARIKMPSGQGIWPAFWMLGASCAEVDWPKCGEIDLMELVNTGTEYHVTLHGPQGDSDYFGGVEAGGRVVGTKGPIADLTTDFHNYWMSWQPNSITIGVDETSLASFTPASLPSGARWVFNSPMYALLDIAVGGSWAGPPDASTPSPATMLVDWFRYVPGATPGAK
jgi:beta-glucanase (GH16 family)